jgi:hypothetical protein
MKSSASVSCLTGDGGNLRRKKVPLAMVERGLELHQEKYFDLNLRHFHEKLTGEHQIQLSYSWVKGIVQGAGLRARGRKRGSASAKARAAALARHAVAHRRQPASLVSG